jgi:nickel transport protein
MMKRALILLAPALILCLTSPAACHEIRYDVEEGRAVLITITEDDGQPLADASYEISPEGGGDPVQTGRTDHEGRIVFMPEESGRWRVKVYSEHGHGTGFSFETGEGGALRSSGRPLFDRYSRVIVGVSLIFGVFGAANLFRRKKSA